MKNPWVTFFIGLVAGGGISAGIFLLVQHNQLKKGKIVKLNDNQAAAFVKNQADPLYKDNPTGALIAALTTS